MIDSELMTPTQRRALSHAAEDLHKRFDGVFGLETIEALIEDSAIKIAARATVMRWLVVSAERLTRERLEALIQAEDHSPKRVPAVLFLCVHNAGRSQMALGWFKHLAEDRAVAWSGGSEPLSTINHNAVVAMAEVGIDISKGFPKPWTTEFFSAADVVVTMGCGEACPLYPGKHYEDWELDDPEGRSLTEVRVVRDDIGRRVRQLIEGLKVSSRSSEVDEVSPI